MDGRLVLGGLHTRRPYGNLLFTNLSSYDCHHFLCADRVFMIFPECTCPDLQSPLQLCQRLVVLVLHAFKMRDREIKSTMKAVDLTRLGGRHRFVRRYHEAA